MKKRLFHQLGRMIKRDQSAGYLRCIFHRIDLGMRNVHRVTECFRSAEDDVFRSRPILVGDIFKSLKPDEINGAGVVREFPDQSFFASFTNRIEEDNASFELDVRHVARDLADPVEPAAVDMFVRKIVQQVFERDHVDLFLQKFGTFRPYSRKIHDVTFADRHVYYKL